MFSLTKLQGLEYLARRFEAETDTIAHSMARQGLTADELGIDRVQCVRLRLCLLPRNEEEIQAIAAHVGVTADVVRKAAGR